MADYSDLIRQIPVAWRRELKGMIPPGVFSGLKNFLESESAAGKVFFPPYEAIYRALELTSPERVRVVILGQDPYHDDGQAEGLAFSVPPGVKFPPSLQNILIELADDYQVDTRELKAGLLRYWAGQGVLLLNAVLTVQAHCANSHRNRGWEIFTDAIIRRLAWSGGPKVFILWGAAAIKKRELIIDSPVDNCIIQSAHPSPLSAYCGFFGSRPFSRANQFLTGRQLGEIDWIGRHRADVEHI